MKEIKKGKRRERKKMEEKHFHHFHYFEQIDQYRIERSPDITGDLKIKLRVLSKEPKASNPKRTFKE